VRFGVARRTIGKGGCFGARYIGGVADPGGLAVVVVWTLARCVLSGDVLVGAPGFIARVSLGEILASPCRTALVPDLPLRADGAPIRVRPVTLIVAPRLAILPRLSLVALAVIHVPVRRANAVPAARPRRRQARIGKVAQGSVPSVVADSRVGGVGHGQRRRRTEV